MTNKYYFIRVGEGKYRAVEKRPPLLPIYLLRPNRVEVSHTTKTMSPKENTQELGDNMTTSFDVEYK